MQQAPIKRVSTYRGFINLHNNCYLHVISQIFFHSKFLRENLQDSEHFPFKTLMLFMEDETGTIFINDQFLSENFYHTRGGTQELSQIGDLFDDIFDFLTDFFAENTSITQFVAPFPSTPLLRFPLNLDLYTDFYQSLDERFQFPKYLFLFYGRYPGESLTDCFSLKENILIKTTNYRIYAIICKPGPHYTVFLVINSILFFFDSSNVFQILDPFDAQVCSYIRQNLLALVYEKNSRGDVFGQLNLKYTTDDNIFRSNDYTFFTQLNSTQQPPTSKTLRYTSQQPPTSKTFRYTSKQSPTMQPVNFLQHSPTKQPVNSALQSPTKQPVNSALQSPTMQPVNFLQQSRTMQPVNPANQSPTKQPVNSALQSRTMQPVNSANHSPTMQPVNFLQQSRTMQPVNSALQSPTKQPVNYTPKPNSQPANLNSTNKQNKSNKTFRVAVLRINKPPPTVADLPASTQSLPQYFSVNRALSLLDNYAKRKAVVNASPKSKKVFEQQLLHTIKLTNIYKNSSINNVETEKLDIQQYMNTVKEVDGIPSISTDIFKNYQTETNKVSILQHDQIVRPVVVNISSITAVISILPLSNTYLIPTDEHQSKQPATDEFDFVNHIDNIRKVISRTQIFRQTSVVNDNLKQAYDKGSDDKTQDCDCIKDLVDFINSTYGQTTEAIKECLTITPFLQHEKPHTSKVICEPEEFQPNCWTIKSYKPDAEECDFSFVMQKWREYANEVRYCEVMKNSKYSGKALMWIAYKKRFLTFYQNQINDEHNKLNKKEIIDQFIACQETNRSIKTLYKWTRQLDIKQQIEILCYYDRGGPHSLTKLTDDVLTFIYVALQMNPTLKPRHLVRMILSDSELRPEDEKISISTVKKGIAKLKFSYKRIEIIHMLKNCFGFKALRVFWAQKVKMLIYERGYFPMFIDETSIIMKITHGYAKKNTLPQKLGSVRTENISLIIWVIPLVGVIFSLKQYSFTIPSYTSFILQGNIIARNAIFNSQSNIFMIQDNCTPHKWAGMKDIFEIVNLPFVNTVPYSPELNYLAENMFNVLKSDDLRLAIDQGTTIEEKIQKARECIINELISYQGMMEEQLRHWLFILDEVEKGKSLNQKMHCQDPEKYNEIINNLKSRIITNRVVKE